jgi:hypothetical protein
MAVIYREDTRTIIREVGTGVGPAGPGGVSAEQVDTAIAEALEGLDPGAVATEASARIAADTALQDALDAEEARAVAAEASKASQANLDTLAGTVAGKADTATVNAALAGKASTAALAQEVTDRQAAITVEQSARATAITTAVNNLIDSAPGTLDTLAEIATALADDDTAVAALTTAVNARALQTDLTSGLASKADAAATTSALASKADAAATTSALAAKADASTVATSLAAKADTAGLPAIIDARVMPAKTDILWTETSDISRFSVVPHSIDTVTAWDRTIVTYGNTDAGAGEGGYSNRLRFTGPAGAGGGNSRIFHILDEVTCKNCEVRVTAVDHSGTGTNNSQIGIIIGYDAATGKAIVVWHDIFVANPRVWNFGLWRIVAPPGNPGAAAVTSSSGNKNWQFRPVLDPPFRYEILDSWRISGVAYYRLSTRDHGIIVGNSVHVVGTGLDTFAAGTVTSVNGSIITFAYAGVDSANMGPGYMQQGTDPHPFPISIAVKRQGDWVLGKFWNPSEPEPFWSDQRYVAKWSLAFTDPTIGAPPTFGKVGVMIGHMTTGKFAEISDFTVEPQDRKP